VVAVQCFAQKGIRDACTLAGTWFGGSVVAYQLTIVPDDPTVHYTIFFQGMYKAYALNTIVTGRIEKRQGGNSFFFRSKSRSALNNI
jgi:hypothetical protein